MNMQLKIIKDPGAGDRDLKISVVFPCFGRYELIEPLVNETYKTLLPGKDQINLIVVLDGEHWENAPLIQAFTVLFPHLQIVATIPECSLPSVLFNVGLERVNTPFVTFVWPGCGSVAPDIGKFIHAAGTDARLQKIFFLSSKDIQEFPLMANKIVFYSWCLSTKILELNNLLISIEVFKNIGRFDPSKIIQKDFDWEFLIRLARHHNLTKLGVAESSLKLGFNQYPYHDSFNFSKDIVHRYILRTKRHLKECHPNETSPDLKEFTDDLPLSDRSYVMRAAKMGLDSDQPPSNPKEIRCYKITIISGYWDFPHNQICFFNYLDKLYGKGFGTYKVLLDSFEDTNTLSGSDLVIFSRCRNPVALKLIRYCNDHQIATLYMLDDNWLWAARDWPEHYGSLFVPGNPNYDTFLEAVKQCAAVLVYNKYLEEDLKPFAQRVIRIPTNIDLKFFEAFPEKSPENQLIGYSGSLRYEDEAFRALAEVAAENPQVKVLILGHITAKQNDLFKNIPIIQVDYNMYYDYYRQLMSLRPLILLAPLDASRSSISKCPNKYLEIAAIGSVGIYSDIHPYNELIRDGWNGFLAGNQKESWKQKISDALQDRSLMATIRENSFQHVKANFATEVVMPQFCAMIDSLIRSGKT